MQNEIPFRIALLIVMVSFSVIVVIFRRRSAMMTPNQPSVTKTAMSHGTAIKQAKIGGGYQAVT